MAKPTNIRTQLRDYERFIGIMLRAELKQARWYGITLGIISLLVGLVVGFFSGAVDAISAIMVAFVLGVDIYLLGFSINNTTDGNAVDRAIAYVNLPPTRSRGLLRISTDARKSSGKNI